MKFALYSSLIFIVTLFSLNSLSEEVTEITTFPLINLEDIPPSYEDLTDEDLIEQEDKLSTSKDEKIGKETKIIANKLAVIKALDKVTAKVTELKVGINESVEFGTISITPLKCYKRPPEEIPESSAYIIIRDLKSNQGNILFEGWMMASNPALVSLEHSVYDVWIIDCES